jgi:hypothetical protein
MEGGEYHEPPRFSIEVNVPRGGWKLAVLRLHHDATLQSAVEATVDISKYFCYCFYLIFFFKFTPFFVVSNC